MYTLLGAVSSKGWRPKGYRNSRSSEQLETYMKLAFFQIAFSCLLLSSCVRHTGILMYNHCSWYTIHIRVIILRRLQRQHVPTTNLRKLSCKTKWRAILISSSRRESLEIMRAVYHTPREKKLIGRLVIWKL